MKHQNYPVSIQKQVRWGEMDALGHVNNTVYFRYFEDVRIVYFEKLGYKNVTAAEKNRPHFGSYRLQLQAPFGVS